MSEGSTERAFGDFAHPFCLLSEYLESEEARNLYVKKGHVSGNFPQ
jgi:hypothetical protein